MHRLCITVRQQAQRPPLATDPALLVPAKDDLRRWFLPAVDEDGAGFELAADTLGVLDVLAPDAGAQTGVGVVGAADNFVFVGPGLAGYDGTCE